MKNFLLPFLLLLLTASLVGQPYDIKQVTEYMDYQRPRDFTIADIEVTGVKFLQTAYLVNISGLSVP